MFGLSIVIPACNEEMNIRHTLEEVHAVARNLGIPYEILLVNDGSQDRTGEIARQMSLRMPTLRVIEHYPNRGYGGALKAGFAAATKDLIVFFPADRQFCFAEVQRLLAFAGEADIVCGIRTVRQDTTLRKVNALVWNLLVRILFGYLSQDVDCGFKLFHRWVLSVVALTSDGAMIDTELLAGARAKKLQILEVPLTHLPRRTGNASGARPGVIIRAVRDLISFRISFAHSSERARNSTASLHT